MNVSAYNPDSHTITLVISYCIGLNVIIVTCGNKRDDEALKP